MIYRATAIIILFSLQFFGATSFGKTLCIGMGFSDLNAQSKITARLDSILIQNGISNPSLYYDFKSGDLSAVHDCFNGDYQRVVMILHSIRTGSKAFLHTIHPETQKDDILDNKELEALVSKNGNSVIGLATCHSERVLETYRGAISSLRQKGIYFNILPASSTQELLTGIEGVRHLSQVSLMAAQFIIGMDLDVSTWKEE